MAKGKRNWLVDAVLFIGFLLTFFLDLTGLAGHQWLGVGVGIFALYHLLLHWKWVIAVTRRIFGQTSTQSRQYYIVDLSLLLIGAAIGISGLIISSWFNIDLVNYLFWKDLHIFSSIAALALILIKIATHWRWIVKTASKYFGLWRQPAHPQTVVPVHANPTRGTMNRREFLQLMGVASLASLISASNLLEIGQETSQEIIKKQTTSLSVPDTAPLSSSCTVICDRGCSFPGECRRYIDLNGNGVCDLTECQPEEDGAVNQTTSSQLPEEEMQQTENEEEITYEVEEGCIVSCPSACAFPGECKDYIDNNGNNLCDLGECLVGNTIEIATSSHQGRQHRGGK